ncbi:cell wall metabolism sensor histidine kinase WalK [Cohnella sp. AR92]|uniref:sensor histidine kinase n=1 Tax=Cohnella sp. AR92 TaxID=648716 RepID=UPI000F8F0F9E|nr:sensor histidine kinase [Cohnella sp. AR92]RUS48931.1 HAMP domain-containing histidine kinase [Cohnella sp. AR92]
MNILLLCVIAILAGFLAARIRSNAKRTSDLRQIGGKLEQIVENRLGEKLLHMTADSELQALMTDINRLLDSSQKASAEHERTRIASRKMLANISHDLRTPLTVVLGYAETLHMQPSIEENERNELLAKLFGKTKEAIQLIDTFFDLAKLESEDIDLPLSRINVSESCRLSILQFHEQIENRGLEVSLDIPPGDRHALGNKDALKRVLDNLISNALRYGADGGIIGLSLREEDAFVVVEVWDGGKGIEAAHQELVFERLYTLDDSRNKKAQGSGLGLAIARRLAEAMGGSIELSSKPYERTVFSVRLKKLNLRNS